MSPRAAWRLEMLGFKEVYDYEGGKLDWLAFGLPSQGSAASEPSIGDVVRRDVPRCCPEERLSQVAGRMAAGWSWCAVVNSAGILLGRLTRRQIDSEPDATAEEVMRNGPGTYRPSTPAAELLERMKQGGFENAFVTDSNGLLWGLVVRADLERALGEQRA